MANAWRCEACAAESGARWAGYVHGAGMCGACKSYPRPVRFIELAQEPTPMSGPTLHSDLGGSIAHRYAACPGSRRLCSTLPKPPSSAAADEGTRLHALAEHCIRQGEWDAEPYAGQWLDSDRDAARKLPAGLPALALDQCLAVNTCLDHFWSLASQPGAIFWTEQSFNLEHIRPGMFGTNDAAVFLPADDVLHVVDFKFGRHHVVEAEGNWQLRYYALGALRSLEAAGHAAPSRFVLTIIQPRASHADGPVRSWEIDILSLLEFEAELRAAVEATEKPDAPLVPGAHCKFCPGTYVGADGRMQCSAFGASADRARDDAFTVVADPPSLMAMSPEELGRRYAEIAILKRYIEEFTAYVKREAQQKVPDGFAWFQGNNRRSWKSNADAVALVQAFAPEKAPALLSPATPKQMETSLPADVFAIAADMIDSKRAAPILGKKGWRKNEMPLADVQAFFRDNVDDAFTTLPEE